MNEPASIIQLNIARYQELLKRPLAEDTRATVERLLAKAELELEDALESGAERENMRAAPDM